MNKMYFIFFHQNYAVDTGFTTSDDFTETSVRIKKLSPRQLGTYVCRAQNKLGSAEREIVVVQQYEPDCIIGLCDRYTSAGYRLTGDSLGIWAAMFLVMSRWL